MHVAFGRVRRKSRIFADSADDADSADSDLLSVFDRKIRVRENSGFRRKLESLRDKEEDRSYRR